MSNDFDAKKTAARQVLKEFGDAVAVAIAKAGELSDAVQDLVDPSNIDASAEMIVSVDRVVRGAAANMIHAWFPSVEGQVAPWPEE